MAKRPERSKPKVSSPEAQTPFYEAMKFLAIIAQDVGAPFQTHVRLGGQMGMTYNGLIALGCNIGTDFSGIPHSLRLLDALSKCKGQYSIATLDAKLAIKSDRFRAVIQCINQEDFPLIVPDPPIAVIDNRLKTAIEIAGTLASETAQLPHLACILLDDGCACGTDGAMLIQAWHGIDLPPGLLLPKATALALAKITKPLARFGFSNSSITLYFEDGSWLRSQMYRDKWPDVARLFEGNANYWPVPESFYTALDAITDFAEDGIAYFIKGALSSHNTTDLGASYEIFCLPNGVAYNIKRLKIIQPYAKAIDFSVAGQPCLMFKSETVRGKMMGMVKA